MNLDILAPPGSDLRGLLLAVLGCILFALLVGVWRIIRTAGLAGLLHASRSLARADLAVAMRLDPMGAIAFMVATLMVSLAVAAALAAVVAAAMILAVAYKAPILARDFLLGAAVGIPLGAAIVLFNRAGYFMSVIFKREALVARLTRLAALPPQPPSSFPGTDSQDLGDKDGSKTH